MCKPIPWGNDPALLAAWQDRVMGLWGSEGPRSTRRETWEMVPPGMVMNYSKLTVVRLEASRKTFGGN